MIFVHPTSWKPLNMLPKKSTNYLTEAEKFSNNTEQWAAYESKGHCVVLAGPGSGKTKVLITKIARMLAEDVRPPRGIACITYSNQCVREIKKRLKAIGIDESERSFVGTIHSFCLQHVLLPYGELAKIDLPTPLKIVSSKEQDRLFADAVSKINDKNPNSVKTKFEEFRRTILDRNSKEWIDDESNATLVLEYERLLKEKGVIDFDGIILSALQMIQNNSWIRKVIKAKFPVLVVDEYQDLGIPLHQIVLSLCIESGIRLFAVGDPDQSIYGFTGARPSLLNELADASDVEKVQLRMNYRCCQTIIDGSTAALAIERDYRAHNQNEGIIQGYELKQGLDSQILYVAETLIPRITDQRKESQLGDIAILYMDKNNGEKIAEILDRTEYKYVRYDQAAPYKRTPLTHWLEECAAWCSEGWRIGEPKLSTIIKRWMSFLISIKKESEIVNARKELVRFLFGNRSQSEKLSDWLRKFVSAGLLERIQTEPAMRDDCETFEKMFGDSTNEEHRLFQYTVSTLGNQRGVSDHLNLTTFHSSKGLEYDVVIMLGLEQGRIPRLGIADKAKEEARRLFYVAMTRARHEVHFLWSG